MPTGFSFSSVVDTSNQMLANVTGNRAFRLVDWMQQYWSQLSSSVQTLVADSANTARNAAWDSRYAIAEGALNIMPSRALNVVAGTAVYRIPIVRDVLQLLHKEKITPVLTAARYTLMALFSGALEHELAARAIIAHYYDENNPSNDSEESIHSFLGRGLLKLLDDKPITDVARTYFLNANPDGLPFSDFAQEPVFVAQIKQLINTLYHAERCTEITEQVDEQGMPCIDNMPWDKAQIIVNNLYAVAHLLTNPDFDVFTTCGPEFKFITDALQWLFLHSKHYSENSLDYVKKLSINPAFVVDKIGESLGTAVNALNPAPEGNFDYTLVSQFGADLPRHLAKSSHFLTAWLEDNGAKFSHDPARWAELNTHGEEVLNGLNRWFVKGKVYSIPAIQEIVSAILSAQSIWMEITKELQNLDNANQVLIGQLLSKFKYQYALKIIGSLDKLEEEMLLKTGTLASPVLGYLESGYNCVATLAANVVDFTQVGHDLRQLHEAQFLAGRSLLRIERQVARDEQALSHNKMTTVADEFFTLLREGAGNHQYLRQFPAELKERITLQFKLIKPELDKLDAKACLAMVRALEGDPRGLFYNDKIVDLLTLAPKLTAYVGQLHAEQVFKNDEVIESALNDDYDSVEQLSLNPYRALSVEERGDAGLDASARYREYASQERVLNRAIEAHDEFLRQLVRKNKKNLLSHSGNLKTLRNLYARFQPMLCSVLVKNNRMSAEEASAIDAKFIDALSFERSTTSTLTVAQVKDYLAGKRRLFLHEKRQIEALKVGMQQQVIDGWAAQRTAVVLERDQIAEERASFLVKNPLFRRSLDKLQIEIRELYNSLNPGIEAELNRQRQDEGTPFPAVFRNPLGVLGQPRQLHALKSLINTLHFLKQAATDLENLPQTQAGETRFGIKLEYAVYVIMFEEHIRAAVDSVLDIINDPYLAGVYPALKTTFDDFSAYFKVIQLPFINTDASGALYRIFDAMFIVHKQFRLLRDKSALEELDFTAEHALANQLKTDIERVAASNSYFRLFLELPAIYAIYAKIKQRLLDFAQDVHSVTVENLAQLYQEDIAQLLIEADRFELTWGLKPGLVTLPLEKFLGIFYRSFIDPLVNNSLEYLLLANSHTPLMKRLSANQESIDKGPELIAASQDKSAMAELFLQHLSFEEDTVRDDLWQKLRPLVQEDAKILKTALKTIWNVKDKLCTKPELDEILAGNDTDIQANPAVFRRIVEIYQQHCRGVIATEQQKQQWLGYQQGYLAQELTNKPVQDEAVTYAYKKTLLYRQLITEYGAKVQRFILTGSVYDQALKDFIKPREQELLNAVHVHASMEPQFDKLLEAEIPLFINEHLPRYQQFEDAHQAMTHLRKYLDTQRDYLNAHAEKRKYPMKAWVLMEDEGTLATKTAHLEQLNEILCDESESVEERLNNMQKVVKQADFKHDMLAHKHYDRFTFAWLVSCIVDLLSALGLFTPERQAIYTEVTSSLPSVEKFGLFGAAEGAASTQFDNEYVFDDSDEEDDADILNP